MTLDVAALRGRALVGGRPVDGPVATLPRDLVVELAEWARAAEALRLAGVRPSEPEGVRVSRVGRRLAARVSVASRQAVDYCDPVTGHRIPLRAITRARVPAVPLPARQGRWGSRTTATTSAEPTPWATGLTLAALVGILVLVVNVSLAAPMVQGLGLWGVLIDVVVAAGLVPALWLNRRVPTWRWAVWGGLAGLGVAVLPLLVLAVGGD